jgi:Ricin-type beta-trefoil lectin domain/Bacterial Ig domain
MPRKTKSIFQKHNAYEPFLVLLFFIIGFGAIGSYFFVTGHAANPAVAITGIAGHCIDTYADKAVNGNKVQLWTCNGGPAQQWQVNGNASTPGTIVNANGYCLGIAGGNTANYTKVILYNCDGNNSQQWYYNPSSGWIVNKLSKTCMDDYHNITTNGNQIDIYTCNNTAAQIWHYAVSPPNVSIRSPGAGATLSGTGVTFSAVASTAAGSITNISLIVNGSTLRSCPNSTSCSVGWNTTGYKNGTYTLQAAVSSTVSGSASTAETVNVSNSSPNPPPPPPPPPNPSPNPSPQPAGGSTGSVGSGSSLGDSGSQGSSLSGSSTSPDLGFSNSTTSNNPMVANIQATNITKSTISLSWQGANASAYSINYGTNQNNLNVQRSLNSTDAVPTYTITNLPASTKIYIKITPSSNGITGVAATANFKTAGAGGSAGVVIVIVLIIIAAAIIFVFWLLRRKLGAPNSGSSDPDLDLSDLPLYPRENEDEAASRLNWWLPEEQRRQSAHPVPPSDPDEPQDMFEEGRKRLDEEEHNKQH